ncbi:MAG TPA: hypothetical protein VFV25_01235, partial [Methylibium sp.]
QGMIVVAPNYLGYDKSSLTYHPYLNAQVQATDMIDGLRAAKNYLAGSTSPIKPTDQLLITGYSQGGHVAMATHQLIEASYSSEFKVTASGPMSGPYNLAKFTTVINASPMNPNPTGLTPCPSTNVNCWVDAGGTLFTPLLLTSYQKAYGNVYTSPSQAYQSPYDKTAETLFPTDTPISTLVQQGELPADPTFTKLFGTGGLINEAFRASFFTDPTNGFKADVVKNTLLGWNPHRPMMLCGGAQDPTVYYFNTTDAQADFASRGVSVPAVDMENAATVPGGATGPLYLGFQAQKAAAGANVLAVYHGELVPPFCTAIVRGFFQQVLASGI